MQVTNNKNYNTLIALILIGSLFFIFGFVTWANSQLIPYLKIACELSHTASYFVATAFFAAFFFMSLPAAYLLKRVGYKRGISIGLFVMSFGAALFIPAAYLRNYPLFLTGLFIIGSGLALLQTAANPYATYIGPIESAAKRISIMGICNKVAGILAVYILGGIILNDADGLHDRLNKLAPDVRINELNLLAEKVITPYIIISIVLLLLGIVFIFIHLPKIEEKELETTKNENKKDTVFKYPQLMLGVVALFLYVGVEVISYDTFTDFGLSLGYPISEAKSFASFTGYSLLAGYLLSIALIPRYLSQRKALTIACILSMILVILSCFTTNYFSIVCFALLGFSNAVIWPSIWPLALDGAEKHDKTGAALLVMAIVGGAVLMPIYGIIAEWMDSKQKAYLMMIPCYLFILFYALKGSKLRPKTLI